MKNSAILSGPARRRRGSVLILVLAVLAVLVLLSVTLSYITKVDLLAARNWGEEVQGRWSALDTAKFKLGSSSQVITSQRLTQARQQVSSQTATVAGSSPRLEKLVIGLAPDLARPLTGSAGESAGLAARTSGLVAGGASTTASGAVSVGNSTVADELATIYYEDESAKINVNAVVPSHETTATNAEALATTTSTKAQAVSSAVSEDMLARFIATTLEAKKVTGVDAQQLAHAIALRRAGADGQINSIRSRQMVTKTSKQTARTLTNSNQNAFTRNNFSRLTSTTGLLTAGQSAVTSQVLSDGTNQTGTTLAAEDGNQAADPRQTPLGDDQPYVTLDELLGVPGMTLPAYRALAPYLTTFSVAFAAFETSGTSSLSIMSAKDQAPTGFPQVDPNTASAAELYQVLEQRFPNASTDLLGQFVANIIDRRGEGSAPTAVRVGGHVYYGMKVNPCINEVCPDVSSDDSQGDDGQYIELCNPYTQTTFSLSGWTVRVKGKATLQLTGSLPPGGYLVLTDDFNSQNDQTHQLEAGTGSFFQIFRKVANPPKFMIKEYPALDLPDDAGLVQLVNPDGQVVDEFEYKDGRWNGSTTSLQRIDPRLRYYRKAEATPLTVNAGQNLSADALLALQLQEAWQSKPFRSPLDVMLVSSAFVAQADGFDSNRMTASAAAGTINLTGLPKASSSADALTSGTVYTQQDTAYAFAMPQLSGDGRTALDVRVVDCFCLGAQIPDVSETGVNGSTGPSSGLTSQIGDLGWAQTERASTQVQAPHCATIFGRLNLNTAPLATLAALPGMDDNLLARVDRARSGAWDQTAQKTLSALEPAWWAPGEPFATPTWHNLSDFLKDEAIWEGKQLYERLDAVAPFSRLVATHSVALRAVSESKVASPQPGAKATRRATMIRAARQLAADRGALETVSFSYLKNNGDAQPDADLLSASSTGGQSYTARMLRQARQANQFAAQQALSENRNPTLAAR